MYATIQLPVVVVMGPIACKEKLFLLTQIVRVGTEMEALRTEELASLLADQSSDISLRLENATEMRKVPHRPLTPTHLRARLLRRIKAA
jgi:hypothetical protein